MSGNLGQMSCASQGLLPPSPPPVWWFATYFDPSNLGSWLALWPYFLWDHLFQWTADSCGQSTDAWWVRPDFFPNLSRSSGVFIYGLDSSPVWAFFLLSFYLTYLGSDSDFYLGKNSFSLSSLEDYSWMIPRRCCLLTHNFRCYWGTLFSQNFWPSLCDYLFPWC